MHHLLFFTLLLGISSWSAWGWAKVTIENGDRAGRTAYSYTIESNTWIGAIQSSRGPIATCDLDYKNCHILEPESFPCYQKMREAMQAMDQHLTTAGEAQKAETLPIEDVVLWHQAMKDCVEGR